MSDDSRKRAKAHSSSGRQKKKDEKASQREDSFTSFSGPAPEGLSIEDAKLGARHTARGLAPIVPDDCTQSFAEGLKAIRARSLEELQELTAQFSVQHIERKTKEWQEKRGSTEKSDHHGAAANEPKEEKEAAAIKYPTATLPDRWRHTWMCYADGSSQQFIFDEQSRLREYVDGTGAVWQSEDGWRLTLEGTEVTVFGIFDVAPYSVRFFNLQEKSVIKYDGDGSRSFGRLGSEIRSDIEIRFAVEERPGGKFRLDTKRSKEAVVERSNRGYTALVAAFATILARGSADSWEKNIELQAADMIRHGSRSQLGPKNPSFIHHGDIVQRFIPSHRFLAVMIALAAIAGRREHLLRMIQEDWENGCLVGYTVHLCGGQHKVKIGTLSDAEKMLGATSKLGFLFPSVLEKAYGHYRNMRSMLPQKEIVEAGAASLGNNDNVAFEMLTGHKAQSIDLSKGSEAGAPSPVNLDTLRTAVEKARKGKCAMIASTRDSANRSGESSGTRGSASPRQYDFLRDNHSYAIVDYDDKQGLCLRDPMGTPKAEFWVPLRDFIDCFHQLHIERI